MNRKLFFILFGLLFVLLFVADILWGSVHIPLQDYWDYLRGKEILKSHAIILGDFRIPKALTACCAGMALSVAGLLMQTLFKNPLAGPYVLGISSGASLGVALLVMAGGIFTGLGYWLGDFALAGMAIFGAATVAILMMGLAMKINHSVSLLIIGLMIGSASGALVGILQYFSKAEMVQSFIVWTFGSLGGLGAEEIPYLLVITGIGLAIALTCIKPMDAMLLGEEQAFALGVRIKNVRLLSLIATSILAGGITAFCGPISFIGLAVPHLCRALLGSSKHIHLLPAAAIVGSCLLLLCDLIAQLPGQDQTLPINAITALFGAPVVIWVILKRKSWASV